MKKNHFFLPQNFLRVELFHQKSTIEHIHTFTRSTFAHDTSGLASASFTLYERRTDKQPHRELRK